MRKLLICIAVLGVIATGCRTTEKNYREAYEKALEKRDEGLTEEERLAIAREQATPKSVYCGDSIPLKAMWVNTVAETSKTAALEYNIVTGTFKQQFNANSAMRRLREGGYPDAFLLIDADKNFIVAASTTSSLDTAVSRLRALEASSPVPLRPPYPFILRKASRR